MHCFSDPKKGNIRFMKKRLSASSRKIFVICGLLLFLEHRLARNVDLAFFKINAWLSFAVLALVLAGRFLP